MDEDFDVRLSHDAAGRGGWEIRWQNSASGGGLHVRAWDASGKSIRLSMSVAIAVMVHGRDKLDELGVRAAHVLARHGVEVQDSKPL